MTEAGLRWMRRKHLLAAIALIGAMISFQQPSQAQPLAPANRIEAHLLGLTSDQGMARCQIFASDAGWPADGSKAVKRVAVEIHQHQATCVFDNVAPGTYAITAIHDLNNNGELDKNFLGVPTEPYGFSNDARGTMGPPSFSSASFQYPGGPLNQSFTLK